MLNSTRAPIIYFFGGRSSSCRLAFDIVSAVRPELDWRFIMILTDAERRLFHSQPHEPDVILSFLNPFILPASLLAKAPAYNVHPATPDYPGRDPWHFARYEGATVLGATLHRMTAKVDAGEILDVIEHEVDPGALVRAWAEMCLQSSITLLVRNLGPILENRMTPRCSRSWRAGAKRSRKDFMALCEIDPVSTSPDELERRIDALHVPGYENLFVRVHGRVFAYKPDDKRATACGPRQRLVSHVEFTGDRSPSPSVTATPGAGTAAPRRRLGT